MKPSAYIEHGEEFRKHNYYVALVLGHSAAYLLQQVHYHIKWTEENMGGRDWWRASYSEWAHELGLSVAAVRKIIERLKKHGVLKVRKYKNRSRYGVAIYYGLDYKKLDLVRDEGKKIELKRYGQTLTNPEEIDDEGTDEEEAAESTVVRKSRGVLESSRVPRSKVAGTMPQSSRRPSSKVAASTNPSSTSSSRSSITPTPSAAFATLSPHSTAPVAALPTPSARDLSNQNRDGETNDMDLRKFPPVSRPPEPRPARREVSPRQLGTSPRQLGTSPRQAGTSPRQLAAAIAGSSSNTHNEGAPASVPSLFNNFEETQSLAALRNLWRAIVTPVFGPEKVVPPSAKDRKNAVDHFMPYFSESGSSMHEFLVWVVDRWKRLKAGDLKWAKLEPIPTFERIFALKGKLLPHYLAARERQRKQQEYGQQQEEKDVKDEEAKRRRIEVERAQTRIYMIAEEIEPDHPLANEITKLIKSGQWAAADWTSCKDLRELPLEQQERLYNEHRTWELAAQRAENIRRNGGEP